MKINGWLLGTGVFCFILGSQTMDNENLFSFIPLILGIINFGIAFE